MRNLQGTSGRQDARPQRSHPPRALCAPFPGLVLGAALMLGTALPGQAETFTDPEWPCVQRKVETLSLGVMWPAPVDDQPLSREGKDLADQISLRRVDLETAEAEIARWISAHPGLDPAEPGRIFRASFERLSSTRSRIMSGIVTYAQKQTQLSARIEAAREEFATVEASETPDFDRLDTLEEQIAWDERIFQDRQRALTYVCETPVLIEKRIYALSRLLQEALPE